MKRAAFCLFVSSCLLLAGCSSDYNGERLYWKAEKVNATIAKDPAKASPEAVEKVIRAFERVIREAPGTLSAARAQFTIGSLHLIRGENARALEAYQQVARSHSQYRSLDFAARMAMAKIYEKQGQREALMSLYGEIAEAYPLTPLGLQAPLAVAEELQRQGKSEQAQAAYRLAITHYTGIIAKAPTEGLALRVKGHLSVAYQRLGEWSEAARMLEALAQAQGQGVDRPAVLLALGSLYADRLHQTEQAKKTYQELLGQFPGHPLAGLARKNLEKLEMPAQNPTISEPAVLQPAGVP